MTKLVYIASPYRGAIEYNIGFARDCCRFAVMEETCPIAPHLLYPQFLDEDCLQERETGLQLGQRLLQQCDELWVCGDRISEGMALEIQEAKKQCIKVRYLCEDEIRNGLRGEYHKKSVCAPRMEGMQ